MKYQLGEGVELHPDYYGYNCSMCGRDLSKKQLNRRLALSENLTIIKSSEVNVSYQNGLEWSRPIGSECAKKFPSESIFEVYI